MHLVVDEDRNTVLVSADAPERAPTINCILVLTILLELFQYAHFVFNCC